MEWIKIKIATEKKGLDIAVDIFGEAGISSVEIEDNEEFLEILEQTKHQWNYIDESLYDEKIKACGVSAYIANNAGAKSTLEFIENKINAVKLADNEKNEKVFGSLEMFISIVNEEDWAENWKKYFKPIPVGENILICPVWEKIPEEYKSRVVFKVDPGMTFGTGLHETTRLCVAALERYIKSGDTVLDLGCGSGILSIIALILGAKEAFAADIDENCVHIAANNAETNNISPGKYTVYAGNLLTDIKLRDNINSRKYDIILMNIVPDIIIPLLPFVKTLLSNNGRAILSGIITKYLPDIENTVMSDSVGLKIIETTSENDWQCVIAEK